VIEGLHHVQVAAPPGCEEAARGFYGRLLGLAELPKPAGLAARGGVWFALGDQQLHVGVDAEFRPARRAHPALLVRGLDVLRRRLEAAGVPTRDDEPIEGFRRFHAEDPWGNRVELLERLASPES
jgi:catechol 2,3-dioxygenase-like lactoylglutathione lyase family enzyme